MAVARGPSDPEPDDPAAGLRSPRVRRRRISSRSFGSDWRVSVNRRRSDGEPTEDEDAQESRMLCSVGAWGQQSALGVNEISNDVLDQDRRFAVSLSTRLRFQPFSRQIARSTIRRPNWYGTISARSVVSSCLGTQ